MKRTLIKNAVIVNEGRQFIGSLVIENEEIAEILTAGKEPTTACSEVIDACGCVLLPGVIDEHVHFRDPGLTHKADTRTESRAAAAGGVTSIMDMPNTSPATISLETLDDKLKLMAENCSVNYSCYFGATNNNTHLLQNLDPHRVCGVKLFMGSSTGNMLVDRQDALRRTFEGTNLLIAAHCENQDIIEQNTRKYLANATGNDLPLNYHPLIRSEEACYKSTAQAIELATAANARLHVLHISTARELNLFDTSKPLAEKQITAEACVPHLLYDAADYETLGTKIKCNPAIKEAANREALLEALTNNKIDTVATDHAPHLPAEKEGGALKAVSGMPMVQFSLVAMLGLVDRGVLTIDQVVNKMCHAPATLYRIDRRGYIRQGYKADLVLVKKQPMILTPDAILSKCGWSPLEGESFEWQVQSTFVNGHRVFDGCHVDDAYRGQELRFE